MLKNNTYLYFFYLETEEQARQRFQTELEFVQCLANPNYLNCEYFFLKIIKFKLLFSKINNIYFSLAMFKCCFMKLLCCLQYNVAPKQTKQGLHNTVLQMFIKK